jgi:hypothetical protein
LDSLRERYPPLDLEYPEHDRFVRRNKSLPGVNGWVLNTTTRYCPDCLAGDGSAIQQAHGGGWRKQWRLAVVFACPIHHRLLSYRCPQCDTPALDRSGKNTGIFPASLLIQHPSRCRMAQAPQSIDRPLRVCGHRLDQNSAMPGDLELPRLLALQDQLLTRMQLDHNGSVLDPAAGSQYFYDLHLILRLIRGSWPFAAQFAPPHVDLDVISDHVDQLHRDMSQIRETGKPDRNLPLRGGPPKDPRASAHLLALAEHLRNDDALSALISSVPASTPWTRDLQAFLVHCSPALQAVAVPYIQSHLPASKASRPRKLQVLPERKSVIHLERRLRINPRYLSHYLEEQHIQPLRLCLDSGITPRLLHRYAVIIAAQSATGLPVSKVMALLDMPPSWGGHTIHLVHHRAAVSRTDADFVAAAQAVIDSLNSNPPEIDYKRRRTALANWSIPTSVWKEVTGPIRGRTSPSPSFPDWGTRTRNAMSTILWSSMTRGDYRASPMVLTSMFGRPQDARLTKLVRNLMFDLEAANQLRTRGPWHISTLLRVLGPYRTDLERSIDNMV